jgi:hypothetical protein
LMLLGAPSNQDQPRGFIGPVGENAAETSPAPMAAVSVPAIRFTPLASAQQNLGLGVSGGVAQTIPSQSTEDGSSEQPLLPDAPTDQNLEPASISALATTGTEAGRNLVSSPQASMADRRSACTAYFAAYGSGAIPESQDTLAPLLAAEDTETAWNSTAHLAFMVLLGGYGTVQMEPAEERRNRFFRSKPVT